MYMIMAKNGEEAGPCIEAWIYIYIYIYISGLRKGVPLPPIPIILHVKTVHDVHITNSYPSTSPDQDFEST
jgi:hypothetical protein